MELVSSLLIVSFFPGHLHSLRDDLESLLYVSSTNQLPWAHSPLDACILNAFQLWSIGQHRPSQLRFREELMHELLKQLPREQATRKRGASLHPAHALANEHFSIRVDQERDCSVCSRRSVRRANAHHLRRLQSAFMLGRMLCTVSLIVFEAHIITISIWFELRSAC